MTTRVVGLLLDNKDKIIKPDVITNQFAEAK